MEGQTEGRKDGRNVQNISFLISRNNFQIIDISTFDNNEKVKCACVDTFMHYYIFKRYSHKEGQNRSKPVD